MTIEKLSWLLQLKFKCKLKNKKCQTTNKYRNWQGWIKGKLFPSFKKTYKIFSSSTTMN